MIIQPEEKDSLEVLQAKKLARVLQVKEKNGSYQTGWGKKTAEGLIATILTITKGELSLSEVKA